MNTLAIVHCPPFRREMHHLIFECIFVKWAKINRKLAKLPQFDINTKDRLLYLKCRNTRDTSIPGIIAFEYRNTTECRFTYRDRLDTQ